MNHWLVQLISQILIGMSPQLREGLKTWIRDMEAEAKTTENPWDDIFVGILKTVLGIT